MNAKKARKKLIIYLFLKFSRLLKKIRASCYPLQKNKRKRLLTKKNNLRKIRLPRKVRNRKSSKNKPFKKN